MPEREILKLETGCDDVNWIELAQVRVQWREFSFSTAYFNWCRLREWL
jgi:hypothetical protein